ncbi:hypothetical protein [Tenacibaculum agarivorans]|uniref:hypothetical protein n=1 Tax=Tenacibaculum agarivorans TaxID=1908389 RepID=UPI00094BB542|nr:hypothetical protein [Tenacibaculum agarivorans]
MFSNIRNLGKSLSKADQKEVNGGLDFLQPICGGDGSFIYQGGVKVCCYVPNPNPRFGGGTYIC